MDIDTVIAVDLDGTLTYTDTLYESVIRLFHDRPIDLLALPLWLMDGKAALKAKVADRVLLNPQSLPYNLRFLKYTEIQIYKWRIQL